jgi:hypothetical protein
MGLNNGPVGQQKGNLPTQCDSYLLGRAEHRIMGIAETRKRRSVADPVWHRGDFSIILADTKSTLLDRDDMPMPWRTRHVRDTAFADMIGGT